jgi:hypothetical protein
MILILHTSFTGQSEERRDEESLFGCNDQAHRSERIISCRSERISRRGTIHRARFFPDLSRDSQILRVCHSDSRGAAFCRPAARESRLDRVCQAQLS